jgi:glycosyltransferase involved in cell wall biosynthesis
VWCPTADPSHHSGLAQLHRLPDHFGGASRRTLAAAFEAEPGRVLLQYVPNALGARGANVLFCFWLRKTAGASDVRVMFHEPYFYFTWRHPLRNALAVVQRLMASVLLRTASVGYISTASWHRFLSPWAQSTIQLVTLPIPATISTSAESTDVARWRTLFTEHGKHAGVVGHFGTYGHHVAHQLRAAIPAILNARGNVRLVCLGRGSDAFAEAFPPSIANRVLGTGALSRHEMAGAVRACDLLVQPYPDGVTTRRTSVMAGLANGVATVTTTGALTEAVWSESRGVALAGADDPAGLAAIVRRLLDDPAERAALAERGARLYDEAFALERTVDVLLSDLTELVRS